MHVLSGTTQIHVEAPPDEVYAIVADVTRTPQWSPEVVKARWVGGATGPAVGARFKGTNRSRLARWKRTCEVLTAEPGREFTFRTRYDLLNRESTVWRYTFERINGGTRVTESYDADRLPTRFIRTVTWLFGDRPDDMTPHMRTSLERIKELAEQKRASARTDAAKEET